ncbi:hypothetical protein CVO77_06550 [Sphingopyxis lindanitolerans]|uniref:Uncharacterized protein n=1 Tax=Sphingopyxis lindanitolerans TaxID=2054227 RepID=A0A2S8B778_9SPHN|nr:hypothetical protein CVO77_06550 [Sphingopyxis lindanitolerans]
MSRFQGVKQFCLDFGAAFRWEVWQPLVPPRPSWTAASAPDRSPARVDAAIERPAFATGAMTHLESSKR